MQRSSNTVSIDNEMVSKTANNEVNGITAVCNSTNECLAVLPTISLKVINSTGGVSTCRALLDSGSQISLITNSCVQRLNISKEYSNLSITGVGQSNSEKTKGSVRLSLITGNQTILEIVAYVLPRITCRLPAQSFAVDMKQIEKVQLADPQFNEKSEIDILVGADFFFEFIRDGTKRMANSQLSLQNTIFGWVVAGRNSCHELKSTERMTLSTSMDLIQLDTTLRQFWEVESVGDDKAILSPEEEMCEDHFVKNTIRHTNGRFILKLPFRIAATHIGNTYSMALRRFHSLENRFSQNPEFKKKYSQFMNEYISLGHMVEIASPQVTSQSYYLPHHGVLKSTDTGDSKLRVVFDGSAQPYEGRSLNSCLAVGPTVQASLFNILLRFREKRYVFSTDVEKMYRQILMAEIDTERQRIIWREDPANELKHYRLQTVTYGLSSAPFLATRALKQIGIDVADRYPKVTATINECVYVDDVMTGADTIDEALTIRNDLRKILSEYGFELRKWKSNCETLLHDIPLEHCEVRGKQFTIRHRDDKSTVKILGLCWDPENDEIIFNVNLPHHMVHSKRTALSDASRLFDPVGWAAPVVIRMKIFVQQLWMKNLDWDDPLPDNLKTEWMQLRDDLLVANSMSIPRYLTTINTSTVEIHGFSDASKLAYAAAVYFKVCTYGDTMVQLITAKTKVAPAKQLSIPKLELAGALLLSRLMKHVIAETRITISQIHAWTDSKDVLDWLSDYPSKWPTFVGNRTAEILTILPRSCWKHVPSEFNPADCASRGMSPKTLKTHTIWWHGPQWLSSPSNNWPEQPNSYNTALELYVQCQALSVPLNNSWLDAIIRRYRSFEKLQYILCYVSRFVSNVRRTKTERILTLIPEPDEMLCILNMICRYEQRKTFSEEIEALRNGKNVLRNSILRTLNPFLDENQVLRVGGRLENSECTYDKKHPIIIHSTSPIVELTLSDIHLRYKHAGPSLLVNILRQTFWIPSIKRKAKGLVRNCVICQRNKATLRSQIMANLPSA